MALAETLRAIFPNLSPSRDNNGQRYTNRKVPQRDYLRPQRHPEPFENRQDQEHLHFQRITTRFGNRIQAAPVKPKNDPQESARAERHETQVVELLKKSRQKKPHDQQRDW